MYVVAGVWTGFDEEWLINEVEAQRVGLASRGWGFGLGVKRIFTAVAWWVVIGGFMRGEWNEVVVMWCFF